MAGGWGYILGTNVLNIRLYSSCVCLYSMFQRIVRSSIGVFSTGGIGGYGSNDDSVYIK